MKPESPTFVGDYQFNGSAESERDIGWYDDPTPEIETRQDARVVQQFGELTNGDEALLRQLVGDDGTAKYDRLAVEADTSISTPYHPRTRTSMASSTPSMEWYRSFRLTSGSNSRQYSIGLRRLSAPAQRRPLACWTWTRAASKSRVQRSSAGSTSMLSTWSRVIRSR